MTLLTATHPNACKSNMPRLSAFAVLAGLHGVWRQRQSLKTLDATALRDIGVTRDQADSEARRPVWDAPSNWLR